MNVHFDMVVTEEMIAEDYESARSKAEIQTQDKNLDKESECYEIDSCLVEENEVLCPYCTGNMIIESKNGLHRCLECGNEISINEQ